MADADPQPARKRIRPSWPQIFGLLAAGIVLVPGLCLAVATTSSSLGRVENVIIGLLGLSLLLVFLSFVLGVVRIIKDIRRR